MGKPSEWNVWEECPVADEAVWLQHATGFATAFITPDKRERWAELLTRRPRQIGEKSHKMHSAIDRRCCHIVSELPPEIRGSGLFYMFFDVPRVVPAERAAVAAGGRDAIFSLVPGKLAVFFFHEGEIWFCESHK
jgi:hypothetical protein